MFEWHAAAVALVLAYPQYVRHNLICIIPFSIWEWRGFDLWISRYAHTRTYNSIVCSVNRLAFAPVHSRWDYMRNARCTVVDDAIITHSIFSGAANFIWNISTSPHILKLFNSIRSGQQQHLTQFTTHNSGRMQIKEKQLARASAFSTQRVINCAIKCLANYFIISVGRLWLQNHRREMNEWIKWLISFGARALGYFTSFRAKMIFSILCARARHIEPVSGGTNLTVTPFVIMFLFCRVTTTTTTTRSLQFQLH